MLPSWRRLQSGNACWNEETGDTYQYGCTDITYTHDSCPYKCGFNTSKYPRICGRLSLTRRRSLAMGSPRVLP